VKTREYHGDTGSVEYHKRRVKAKILSKIFHVCESTIYRIVNQSIWKGERQSVASRVS